MRMMDPTRLQLAQSVAVGGRRFRYGFVDTGVPHTVVPVRRLEQVAVERLGCALRHHRRFSPSGTNVDFIQPDGRGGARLRIRTYERGVEAETLACGTGVAAAAIVHAMNHGGPRQALSARRRYRLGVQTRSGDVLRVSFAVVSSSSLRPHVTDLILEGEARWVFDAVVGWPMRRR
jgi:diaminopimelate epimerase